MESELAPVMEGCLTFVTGILLADLWIMNLQLMLLGKLKERNLIST